MNMHACTHTGIVEAGGDNEVDSSESLHPAAMQSRRYLSNGQQETHRGQVRGYCYSSNRKRIRGQLSTFLGK